MSYNDDRFFGEAIASSLAQTHPEVEVIADDDGATDASGKVIEYYGRRITAVRQANAGQTKARAEGCRRPTAP